MFGKIVAISTVKHLSRNYASFQQPSVQEWYSLSTSGQAQSIPQRNTVTFMEMDTSCRTQDTKQKKSPSWCVMLTLNKRGCKLIFDFGADFLYKPLKTSRIGFMPKDQNRQKQVIMHKFTFLTHNPTFSCSYESLCCPCVRF